MGAKAEAGRNGGHPLPVLYSNRLVEEEHMTEVDADVGGVSTASIEEALALIDRGLGVMIDRQLISTAEMTDLLLDVRSLLSVSSANS